MVSSVIAAVTNVVLNYVCILKWGFLAAGYTTMFANVLLVCMHYYNMRRIEPTKIFDPKFVVISVGILSAACLSCNLLYRLPSIIRYAAILITLIVMYTQKDNTIKAINRMKV